MGISLKREGAVGVMEMNNPPANAYTNDVLAEMAAAIGEIREDDRIRAVVVTSALEKFFCAGADISVLRDSDAKGFANFLKLAHETMDMIETTPKIFIAAIAGHCIGGGLELALTCDLRFAAEGKYGIGLAEVNLGLSPGMGGTQRLPRLIPKGRALELMITGRTIPPAEAHAAGIVERVIPAEKFMDEVMEFAGKLAAGASLAQGTIKLSVNRGLEAPLDQALAIERANQMTLFDSADAAEGVAAFLEKRPAKYTGK